MSDRLETIDEEPVLPETHPLKSPPAHDRSIDGFTALVELGFNPDILTHFMPGYLSHAVQTRNHILNHHEILDKISSDPFNHTPPHLTEAYKASLERSTEEWHAILHTFHTTAKTLLPPFSPSELAEREELSKKPFFEIFPKETLLIFTTAHLNKLDDCKESTVAQEGEYRSLKRNFWFLDRFPQMYNFDDYDDAVKEAEKKMVAAQKDFDWFDNLLKGLAEPVLEESRRLETELEKEREKEEVRKIEEDVLEKIELRLIEEGVLRKIAAVESRKKAGLGAIGTAAKWFSGKKS
ncbi:hypothetical protein HYALB_00012420 [Hymenoscyphus albidus]|uniref:Uncharacterized protein n=1 Tax=Hymenoscyphus albidus TaxID=595503 RepID=A0A9N9LW10_9HELO|nr:hypothetical protein HYALB_00012420 [Hymenoscyphus albidus]